MKKKQLAKLKKQFRPSFEVARKMLFESLEEKTVEKYNLTTKVYIKPENKQELAIELVDDNEAVNNYVITVPLDENFNVAVKRIQSQEKGFLERFSSNLADEVASYWTPATPKVAKEVPESNEDEGKKSTDGLTFVDFNEQIQAFPKFQVEQVAEEIRVIEKTAKENRLLATISAVKENEFVIESALERKYKLKLDVIPIIEAFAQTSIGNR
ncbi:hypothetical protein DOK78_002485 [Enterococcus sp. DIV2402]|uniref:Uncharacterized protein n=1 Tax=Candidatus Enterococcus lowellii TaxID=2230877 RepID=A0ABZ2SQN8_9ENTE|nr:hypothetical protein [Enterococcus sp. DIV2402]MBO0463396.1 hypothetical protein [Enterococcus sp. DIV2402]